MIGKRRGLILIGVCGEIGSGKDTVANILADNHGYQKIAFADKLKEACRVIFGFSNQQVYGTQEQKGTVDPFWGFSPRSALQRVGTNAIRNIIGDDVWVKSLYLTLMANDMQGKFVISDCRFFNEVDMIRSLGGEIWCVERRKFTKWERFVNRLKDILGLNHPSEQLWHRPELADRVVDNTGSLKDLVYTVEKMEADMIHSSSFK